MSEISVPIVLSRLLLVGVFILLATLFSIAVPAARETLFAEDRVVEWLTVVAFAAAFVVGIRKLRGGAGSDLLLLAATLLAALAVLDELSFGERIFGWEGPLVFGTKLDAAHDLFRIGQKVIKRYSDTPYLVAAVGLLVLGALAALLVARLRRRGWDLILGPELVLIGAAILCLAVAQGIDIHLRILLSDILEPLYFEEILELSAGILFLFFALMRRSGQLAPMQPPRQSV